MLLYPFFLDCFSELDVSKGKEKDKMVAETMMPSGKVGILGKCETLSNVSLNSNPTSIDIVGAPL